MSRSTILKLVVFLLVAVVGAMFVAQNAARTTQLSFNLGLVMWQLEKPLPVMALLGGAFGGGLLLGLALLGARSMRLSRKVRQLEQQIALSDTGSEWR